MSKDNAGQVLIQVQDLLRGSSLRGYESGMLAFQLLVWAHLSSKAAIEADIGIDAALQHGASGIAEALNRMARTDGALGHAFSGAPRQAQFAGDFIVSAVAASKRLVDGGIFERFSPVEISADIAHSPVGDPVVPAELAKLMAHLTVGSEQLSAYCPWEPGGQLIGALLRDDVRLYAEMPNVSSLAALLSLFREALTSLAITDPLRSPTAIKGGHLEKFDAALSFPPIGTQTNDEVAWQDIYGRFPVMKATSTGLMVQHILAHTDGVAAIIVPNSFLSGPGKDRQVREYLLDKGWVEAVVALPIGIHQISNFPTSLLVLNTQSKYRNVGFVDASQPHFRKATGKSRVTLEKTDDICKFCYALRGDDEQRACRLLDESLAVVASVHEVLDNEASLQVDRYVIPSHQRDLQARLDAMPTVVLESIASLHNPIPNRDRNSDTPSAIPAYEVGAADLPKVGFIAKPEKIVNVLLTSRRVGNPEDVFLRPGDVLLVIKGSVGKIGIVPDEVPPAGRGGWIAGQSAIVLRGKRQYQDLRGLALWLRSQMGRNVLAGIASGTTIPMISVQTLRKLAVPSLTLEVTDRAVEILHREAEIERRIEALKVDQSNLSEQLWRELLN